MCSVKRAVDRCYHYWDLRWCPFPTLHFSVACSCVVQEGGSGSGVRCFGGMGNCGTEGWVISAVQDTDDCKPFESNLVVVVAATKSCLPCY